MKKLIAISVMIALVAGAVFADTSISGGVETRLQIFQGQFGDFTDESGFDPYEGSNPKPITSGSIANASIQLSGSNDDGTLGGTFRLRGQDIVNTDYRWHKAFIWWKPVDQIKLFLGVDADGMFETGQMTSWAFHQGSEGFLCVHNWDFWRDRFPGNWDTFGAAFSFYLVDGLDLNLVLPVGQSGGWPRHHNAAVTASKTLQELYPGALQLTAGYNIQDVGKFAFAWIGAGTDYFDEDNEKFGKIALSFFSNSIVQGLSFQLGGATDISSADDPAPIDVGLAVAFSSGDFGLKFRIGTNIEVKDAGGLLLITNIMPTLNVAGLGKVCLDIGVIASQKDKDADTGIGFWVNPYLKKGLSGGYFQMGLVITNNVGALDANNVSGDELTRVYFPMLLGFNF